MIHLSADKRHLEIQVDGHAQDIPLFTLNGEADIWRWRFYLRGKSWCSPELLAEFERLVRESWKNPFYGGQAA
jgi:hypothetical protein